MRNYYNPKTCLKVMSQQRAITRVTRGHQMTIPKAIREKVGLRIGDVVEVTADNAGRITARKLETRIMAPLDFGEEFAKKHGITAADILRLSRSVRREVFKEDYE